MNRIIIKKPHISEKTTQLTSEGNYYTFVVDKNANKIEIKKAVEEMYDVKVVKVTVSNISAKKRRLGLIEGKKKGYKKAMVRIKEGETIEMLSA